MDRREARRIAVHRAGLIIESALNEGWEPDDLMDRYGAGAVDKIREEMADVAERMVDGAAPRQTATAPEPELMGYPTVLQRVGEQLGRMQEAAKPTPPRVRGLEDAVRQTMEHVAEHGVLSRLCFHPGGAPAVWCAPEDGGPGYWERRCGRCGAWAQNRYTVPFLGPALLAEGNAVVQRSMESNEQKATGS